MMITLILFILLAYGGLFVTGLCVGRWMRSSYSPQINREDMADDVGLFFGWDELSAVERKRRLDLYQRRVLARSAEQDRAWLRGCVKG